MASLYQVGYVPVKVRNRCKSASERCRRAPRAPGGPQSGGEHRRPPRPGHPDRRSRARAGPGALRPPRRVQPSSDSRSRPGPRLTVQVRDDTGELVGGVQRVDLGRRGRHGDGVGASGEPGCQGVGEPPAPRASRPKRSARGCTHVFVTSFTVPGAGLLRAARIHARSSGGRACRPPSTPTCTSARTCASATAPSATLLLAESSVRRRYSCRTPRTMLQVPVTVSTTATTGTARSSAATGTISHTTYSIAMPVDRVPATLIRPLDSSVEATRRRTVMGRGYPRAGRRGRKSSRRSRSDEMARAYPLRCRSSPPSEGVRQKNCTARSRRRRDSIGLVADPPAEAEGGAAHPRGAMQAARSAASIAAMNRTRQLLASTVLVGAMSSGSAPAGRTPRPCATTWTSCRSRWRTSRTSSSTRARSASSPPG